MKKLKTILGIGILLTVIPSAFAGGRAPANYFPADDFQARPIEHKSWIQFIYKDDSEGILNDMRNTFSNWERQENYARVYNLKGLEISTKEKTKYLGKYFLKYLNRRISEEAKVAKAGSNFKKVNKARKTLNPKLKIGFSENVRLRFRGSPLKGTGSMHLQNPWIDVKLQAEITGAIFFECSKDFRNLKLNSKVNYDIAEDKMMAEVTKHIIKGMDANVTYENRGLSRHDNLLLQVRFSKTF